MTVLLVFDTTHHALWAEQIAHDNGYAADAVPAPPESRAKCDIALEILPEERNALVALLRAEGVHVVVFERADS